MTRQHCPYCYHAIDGNALWFQCTGRGSPGRDGCRPELDRAREQLTGYRALSRSTFPPPRRLLGTPDTALCPICGGLTGVRVCPVCHTALPISFQGTHSPLIALIGAKYAGKSVYLKVLVHQLMRTVRRQYGADVRFAASSDSYHHADGIESIFGDLQLLPATRPAISGRVEPLVLEWRSERNGRFLRRGYRSSVISFYDTAGEDLTSLAIARDLAYFSAADGLVLLIDPLTLHGVQDRIVTPPYPFGSRSPSEVLAAVTESVRAAHAVRSTRRIRLPISVVLTKFDLLFDLLGADHPLLRLPEPAPAYDETAGLATHEMVRHLLYEWDADDIDTYLRLNYDQYRYFVVSSLGAAPDEQTNTISPYGVRPFRVEEPLTWLLSQFSIVPRRGG